MKSPLRQPHGFRRYWRWGFLLLVITWLVLFLNMRRNMISSSLRGSQPLRQFTNFGSAALNNPARHFSHAIIVACHAVMNLEYLDIADRNDNAWYLLPYQRHQSFPQIIWSHTKAGVDLVNSDPQAMLLFSGGQTRIDVGPTSEAASYFYLARHQGILHNTSTRVPGASPTPVYLEEYARDSYENLLFSICRFREIAGHYPQRITVVGFDFKEERFSQQHRAAIGFPAVNFSYVGIHPSQNNFDNDKARKGEAIAQHEFAKDPYGCGLDPVDKTLVNKRVLRNPFKRSIPYSLSCPEMEELFDWCGPQLFNSALLPWGQKDEVRASVEGGLPNGEISSTRDI